MAVVVRSMAVATTPVALPKTDVCRDCPAPTACRNIQKLMPQPALLSRLRTFVTRGLSRSRSRGFVYVPAGEELMKTAAIGAIVRNADGGPPWIVVNHALESVVVAKWPGRLWQVEILKAAAEQALSSAGYTRAVSVRVIGEHPVATLFGPHGHLVCGVIDKARTLVIADVPILGQMVSPLACQAYSRAWSHWLGETQPGDRADDHRHTLAIVSGGPHGRSPIGGGLTVLYSVLTDRARALAGDAAFVVGEEGDSSFAAPWDAAAEAFLHAAMAYGAPELLSSVDVNLLTAAWTRRYGQCL
jgi:hypothetical protein